MSYLAATPERPLSQDVIKQILWGEGEKKSTKFSRKRIHRIMHLDLKNC